MINKLVHRNLLLFYIAYTILVLYFMCVYEMNMPPYEILCIQVFIAVLSLFTMLFMDRYKVSMLYYMIFIFQLICSVILRCFFIYYYNNPLGENAIDSTYYHLLSVQTYRMSFDDFISYLKFNIEDLSDFGFPIVQYSLYKISGDPTLGINLMVLYNVILHLISCVFVYKLSMIITKDKVKSKIVLVFWGFNFCSIWLNVSGLKEQTFLFFIVLTMYALYSFFNSKRKIYLCLFILGITIIWFFRYYLSLFFILIFISKRFVSQKIYKNIYPLVFIFLFVVVAISSSLLNIWMPEFESLENVVDYRLNSPSEFVKYSNFILTFISPFPNIVNTEAVQNMYFVPFSLLKVSISGFYMYMMYKVFTNRNDYLYPIISFICLDILLCMVSGFVGNYRYLYCMMPFYFIISVIGSYEIQTYKYKNIYCFIYLLICFLLFFQNNLNKV